MKTVVDIGCGNGVLTAAIATSGFRVMAIDQSEKALKMCELNMPISLVHRIKLVHSTFKYSSLPDSSADAIIAVRSLNHGDRNSTRHNFEILSRKLRGGGVLFLYITARGDLRSVLGSKIDKGTWAPTCGPEAGIPHYFLSIEELKDWLPEFDWVSYREDGFLVPLDTTYFSSYPECARRRMKEHQLSSRHHCLLAKKREY